MEQCASGAAPLLLRCTEISVERAVEGCCTPRCCTPQHAGADSLQGTTSALLHAGGLVSPSPTRSSPHRFPAFSSFGSLATQGPQADSAGGPRLYSTPARPVICSLLLAKQFSGLPRWLLAGMPVSVLHRLFSITAVKLWSCASAAHPRTTHCLQAHLQACFTATYAWAWRSQTASPGCAATAASPAARWGKLLMAWTLTARHQQVPGPQSVPLCQGSLPVHQGPPFPAWLCSDACWTAGPCQQCSPWLCFGSRLAWPWGNVPCAWVQASSWQR